MIETVLLYKINFDMIYYSEMLLTKFPKYERNQLVKNIRDTNFEIMRFIIKAYKEPSKSKKIYYLNEIDVNLKMLKVYVRIAYKKKYISSRNYGAYSRKITNVNNVLLSWFSRVKND